MRDGVIEPNIQTFTEGTIGFVFSHPVQLCCSRKLDLEGSKTKTDSFPYPNVVL